jgi:myo-inositol-1(or 4)-monophosphatase
MTSDLELAVALATEAANLAANYFRAGVEIRYKKAPGDVVSVADEEAEELIRRRLQEARPDDGMLGEEGVDTPGARRWLVDAIDGTLNFLRGDPFWCTALALQDEQGSVVSAVHHVASGETFSAARGQGCWLNGEPLRRPAQVPLSHAVLATYLHPGDGQTACVHRVLDQIASTRIRGSGSLELAWLAAGRVDVWLQRNVLLWDLEPGSLLAREAGAVTGDVDNAEGRWSFGCDPCSAGVLSGLLAEG